MITLVIPERPEERITLWVNGANVCVGTTIHSTTATTSPALVGGVLI
jgi:hypothetical protein